MTESARHFLFGAALLAVAAMPAAAQQPADDFRQNCFNCHTIGGGRLTGPDLKDVTQRQQREWLVRFILNPKVVVDSGDPYARELLQQARGIVMPAVSGMTPGRAAALLDLIEAESQLEESQFKGLQMSDRPFTAEDVALGKRLFMGEQRLLTGSPACLSCHTVKGLSGLSGGRLGPDLSRAFERLGGRQRMGAWLTAPPTPTMKPLFQARPLDSSEIMPLIAFLEDAARQGGEDQSVSILNFFFLGLGGTVMVLAAFDAIWKRRFRSVRAALVERIGILAIGSKHRIPVLEDAAQCVGGSYKGKPLGSLGAMGIFRHQVNKTISSGEGGSVVTNDPLLFERAVRFHDVGGIRPLQAERLEGGPQLEPIAGVNFRMTEWQGGAMLEQVRKLDGILARTRASYERIRSGLSDLPGIKFRKDPDPQGSIGDSVYIEFGTREQRDRFLEAMKAENVPCRPPAGSVILPVQRYIENIDGPKELADLEHRARQGSSIRRGEVSAHNRYPQPVWRIFAPSRLT